ncbi:hypothetical protein BB559_003930 [Furculomyces boomerangus]|uniref:Uncharacterized protein n=2 Tax=Harpellales TaxID=61421 RepID=A0A2T9YHT6_9FUNG|nr:hypothetical protein BB559_003930 [Furculomyces boomerangus]
MEYFENTQSELENEEIQATWRIEPLGLDSKHRIFWLFNDTRLYRQTISLPQKLQTQPKEKKKAGRPKRKQKTNVFKPKSESSIKLDEGTDVLYKKPKLSFVSRQQPNKRYQTRLKTNTSHRSPQGSTDDLVDINRTNSSSSLSSLSSEDLLNYSISSSSSENKSIDVKSEPKDSTDIAYEPASDAICGNIESDGDIWELVCISVSDWENFPETFKGSKGKLDMKMYSALSGEVSENAIKIIKSRIRKKKTFIETHPPIKKSLRILMKQTAEEEKQKEMAHQSGNRNIYSKYTNLYSDHISETPKKVLSRAERYLKRESSTADHIQEQYKDPYYNHNDKSSTNGTFLNDSSINSEKLKSPISRKPGTIKIHLRIKNFNDHTETNSNPKNDVQSQISSVEPYIQDTLKPKIGENPMFFPNPFTEIQNQKMKPTVYIHSNRDIINKSLTSEEPQNSLEPTPQINHGDECADIDN